MAKKKKAERADFEGCTIVTPDVKYWSPKKPGEMLEGVYLKSYKGTKATRYIVQDDQGIGWIVPNVYYMREVFKKLETGTRVRIRFESYTQTESGAHMYEYTVGLVPDTDTGVSNGER